MPYRNIFQGQRVLIAEDDVLTILDTADALEASGAEVVGPIGNLDDALERVRAGSPVAAAVLDLSLRGHHVWPLADQLMKRGVPFVFATGYDGDNIPSRFAHIQRFLKPVPSTEIVTFLADATVTASAA